MKKRILSMLVVLCMIICVMPIMVFATNDTGSVIQDVPTYKEYTITQHTIDHIQSFFDGVAEVTENGDTITVKFTSNIYGYIRFGGNAGKVIFDLNGKTIDPGDSNEAICLDHNNNVTLTITGEGTIKKGANNVIYVGNNNTLYFAPAKGMHYFTLKQGDKNVFSDENTERKSSGTIGKADDLVMTQGVYTSTYTIVFAANGGEGTMEPQSVPVGHPMSLSPNTFTKEDKTFIGWALSPDGKKEYSDEAAVKDLANEGESITLYALWEKASKDYEIFKDDLADVQAVLEEVADVTKDDATGVIAIKLTSDVYGRLHFNNNSGKFVLDLNGKTIDPVSRDESICLNHSFRGNITITGSGTIKKGNNNAIYCSRATIYFTVAEDNDYFTLKTGNRNVFDNKNYETKETNNSISRDNLVMTQYPYYTITFDANGYGTAPAAIEKVEFDTKISAPAVPTANGYVFGGWYKEPTCENAWDFANDLATADTTLYARWTEAPHGIYGDVTGDGQVDDFDWMTILNHTSGEIENDDIDDMTTVVFRSADVTLDGIIDDFDWMTILNHTSGEIVSTLIETEF